MISSFYLVNAIAADGLVTQRCKDMTASIDLITQEWSGFLYQMD